jgi:tripartite-type tricarboxylate transporter receptor subunit TctC
MMQSAIKLMILPGALSLALAACAEDPAVPVDDSTAEGEDPDAVADFPQDAVEYIIPFDPGGESDITARQQQPHLEELLESDIVIDYMPGGGGALAWSQLPDMRDDGHTIVGLNLPNIIVQPPLREDAGYDVDDFKQLMFFQYTPSVFVATEDSPYEDLEDLLEDARDRPGEVTVGGASEWSQTHTTHLLLEQEADVEMQYVAHEGTGPAIPNILGGHFDAGVIPTPNFVEHRDQLKALAVAADEEDLQQLEALADEPTFIDQGYDVTDGAYRGLAVPLGVPDEVNEILYEAFKSVNEDPDFAQDMADNGFVLVDIGPDDAAQHTEELAQQYAPLIEVAQPNDE